MMAMRLWISMLSLAFLTACASQSLEQKIVAEGGQRRTAAELRERLTQKVTVYWVSMTDNYLRGTSTYTPDGAVEVKWRRTETTDQGWESDTGKWTIEGDMLCRQPSKGAKICQYSYKGNNNVSYSLNSDGKAAYKSVKEE